MEKVYVIMFQGELFENIYYTDEEVVSNRVENLNEITKQEKYSYFTLFKKS